MSSTVNITDNNASIQFSIEGAGFNTTQNWFELEKNDSWLIKQVICNL